MKQASLLCPHHTTESTDGGWIRWRTRDGKHGLVPATPDTQAVVYLARTFAASPDESMVPVAETFGRWRRRFYRHCRRIGLTRRAGLTPQRLHGCAQGEGGVGASGVLELVRDLRAIHGIAHDTC
ncbi:MAG: hypothetical protein WDO56_09810 [Gammaproteobacteria bacterium]